MDIFEKCYQRYIQDEVREQGVYPYFRALESRQDTEVIMEGKRRIMLGSNNYLGLTTNSSVIEAGVQAYRTLGSGCSGSRFLNGTLKLHLELEDELAKFLRKDAVVTFSTGFQSNLGIISSIVGLHDYVIMDRENHASLYDGCKLSYGKMLRYQHNDMADLEKKLQKVPDTAGCLIVTDGVFSMGGDIARLPEICALAKKYGARVMVDDAHGLGVLGDGGRGTASYFGLEDQVDVYMGTFSKSLASLGGYMAASEEVAEYVRHASRPFIFSASTFVSSLTSILPTDSTARRSSSRRCRGKRYAGMPYRVMPPSSLRASKTVTPCPMRARKYAHVMPEGPPPTTATRRPVSGWRLGTSTLSAATLSTANFLMPRMSHFQPGSFSITGFAFSSFTVVGNSLVTSPSIS